jgi:hypothetical protein
MLILFLFLWTAREEGKESQLPKPFYAADALIQAYMLGLTTSKLDFWKLAQSNNL